MRATFLVLLLALPATAAAQAAMPAPSPWALGLAAEAGGMLTDDQREQLALDGAGGLVRLELRARPLDTLGVDWLETDLRGSFTVVGPGVGGEVGGVLDVSLGARVAPRFDIVRPYLSVAFGAAFTGELARPVGSSTLGVAFALDAELSLGPELGVQHVIQWDGPGETSDAVFFFGGVAFGYRPVPHPPPPPPEVIVEERIVVEEHTRVVFEPPFDPAPPPEPTRIEELTFLMEDAVCGHPVEVVTLLPPVLFDHDQAELTAAGEVAMHDVLARVLEAPAEARIVIEGHADVTGTSDYNEALALARAHTVALWLEAHGVSPERLTETGQGDRAPLVDGESHEALAPNRRVTIRIEETPPPSTGTP